MTLSNGRSATAVAALKGITDANVTNQRIAECTVLTLDNQTTTFRMPADLNSIIDDFEIGDVVTFGQIQVNGEGFSVYPNVVWNSSKETKFLSSKDYMKNAFYPKSYKQSKVLVQTLMALIIPVAFILLFVEIIIAILCLLSLFAPYHMSKEADKRQKDLQQNHKLESERFYDWFVTQADLICTR